MNNSAQVLQPGATAVKLITLGKLILMSPQTSVGTSSQPIYEADVGGGCGAAVTSATHTCTVSDKVYAAEQQHARRRRARRQRQRPFDPDGEQHEVAGWVLREEAPRSRPVVDRGGADVLLRDHLGNSVQVRPLPAITNLPLGAPISPNVHAAPGTPTFSG